jgi:DNA repair photolyase
VPTIPPYKFASEARAAFHANACPRKNLIAQLEADCRKAPGSGQRVLLSFTTDPYQPADSEHRLTRDVIQTLHRYGYHVQILTKGGARSLVDLDLFTNRDAYAATMTLLSDEHSRKWEPEAALPAERIYALHAFHETGIPTWVSLEPVLSPDSAIAIIEQTHTFVDLFKIGKLNHHPMAERIDWADFALRAVHLCESLDHPYYIKDDLAAFLPDGVLGPCHVTAAEIERRM